MKVPDGVCSNNRFYVPEWKAFAQHVCGALHLKHPLDTWVIGEMFGRQEEEAKESKDSLWASRALDALSAEQRIALDCIVESGDSEDPRAIAIMKGFK